MPKSRFRKQLFDFMELTASNSVGELWLYGDIVDDAWWDNEVSPTTIRDSLNEMGPVEVLDLHINSYGGSCVAGNAIVNIIDYYKRKTGARVNAYIDGIAASMGSGIAMAADYIYMAENAIFMVHKPFALAIGNSDDMEHEAEVLNKVEDTLVANYMRHFNGTEEEMRQLMADESWLTADEALTYGLCDEVVAPVQIAASAKGLEINGKNFHEEKLKDKFKETEKLKDGDNVFEYDEVLGCSGINEDDFNELNVSSEVVHKILDLSKWRLEDEKKNFHDNCYICVSKEMCENFLGTIELNDDELMAFAKAGMEMDHNADAKAKAYDKLVNAAIDDAIKSGVRAKGDDFNDAKWKKILNTLDYEEIIDQKNEWEAEAKLVLKAGKKVSQSWEQDKKSDYHAVNIDDFKL